MNKYLKALHEIEATCLCIDSVSDADVYLNPIRELVDKSTPEKPVKGFYDMPVFGECVSEHYLSKKCPICNETLWIEYVEQDKYPYCPNCGQKIDWSEEEC